MILSLAAHDLLLLYSKLHWPILSRHYGELSEPLKHELFAVMGRVGIYRLAPAVFALGFAIWAIPGKPRWPGLLALTVSFVAIFEAVTVM